MRITVFTPTYNREYKIEQLYRSLQKQTFSDFEWLVVDDGSTDKTELLFDKFQRDDNSFPIRYIKTQNGGKHRAINRGVRLSLGELFYIVDSDDYLNDDALEIIDRVEKTIPNSTKNQYAGVCGIKSFATNEPIGNTFEGTFLDITMLERQKYKIEGDKAEVFYTKLLKLYPFPEFENENFITECIVWDKIAHDGYKLRFFNEVTMICEYLPDGLSAAGDSKFLKNPKGWGLYLYQCSAFSKITGIKKWNSYLHYYYKLRNNYSFFKIARNLRYSPFALWNRLFFLRLFYRLYDK